MGNRSNLGRSNARRSAAARTDRGLLGIVDALGLTLNDLYPLWDLQLPDGSIVQQRGADGIDAARRYYRAHDVKPTGVRRHKSQEPT